MMRTPSMVSLAFAPGKEAQNHSTWLPARTKRAATSWVTTSAPPAFGWLRHRQFRISIRMITLPSVMPDTRHDTDGAEELAQPFRQRFPKMRRASQRAAGASHFGMYGQKGVALYLTDRTIRKRMRIAVSRSVHAAVLSTW